MALRHARFACVLSMASTLNSVGGEEGFGGGGLIIRGGRNVWEVARTKLYNVGPRFHTFCKRAFCGV